MLTGHWTSERMFSYTFLSTPKVARCGDETACRRLAAHQDPSAPISVPVGMSPLGFCLWCPLVLRRRTWLSAATDGVDVSQTPGTPRQFGCGCAALSIPR